jgi:hypothetical protein
MRRATLPVVVLLAVACRSGDGGGDVKPAQGPIVKVRVYSGGRMTLDDTPISIEGLTAVFVDLKEKGGSVWYYGNRGESEPHPNAMAVVQAVIEARLPISFSSEEDFSNVVLPEGTTKPRE